MDEILADIHNLGWKINNLFERNDGLWQANCRNATHATAWGLGRTYRDALEAAFDQLHNTVPLREQCVNYTVEVPSRPSLRDIIALPKPAPLVRRIG